MDDQDHDLVEEFQDCLDNEDKKQLKITTTHWSYSAATKWPFLDIERRTGWYFYHNITSDDNNYFVSKSAGNIIDWSIVTSKTERDPKRFQDLLFWTSHAVTFMQDQTLVGSNNHEKQTNSFCQSETDITVLERKISWLETKYRQMWQQWKQQCSVLKTKDNLSASNMTPIHKTSSPCLPCQHCGCAVPRLMTCTKVTVCLTCKSKNHDPHHICPMLQNPAVGQTCDQKGYHLDDP